MHQATIGRIIHVLMDPAVNNGADVAPAIITRAWSDTCVNLRALRDGYPDPSEWMTSVALYQSREELEADCADKAAKFGGSTKPYGAFWPSREHHGEHKDTGTSDAPAESTSTDSSEDGSDLISWDGKDEAQAELKAENDAAADL